MTINSNQKENSALANIANKEASSSDISPFERALHCYILIKKSLKNGETNPSNVLNFGQSLIDYNSVPVDVGNDNKIFSTPVIIKNRQNTINKYIYEANKKGIDLTVQSEISKSQAEGIAMMLGIEGNWENYQPNKNQGKTEEDARFIELNFANFVVGNMIIDHIKKNYQIR